MKKSVIFALAALATTTSFAQRNERLLKNWEFSRDSTGWKNVTIPHDWAIYGPFDRKHDLQKVAVEQNGEKEETWKTGRTGGLLTKGKDFTRLHSNSTTLLGNRLHSSSMEP